MGWPFDSENRLSYLYSKRLFQATGVGFASFMAWTTLGEGRRQNSEHPRTAALKISSCSNTYAYAGLRRGRAWPQTLPKIANDRHLWSTECGHTHQVLQERLALGLREIEAQPLQQAPSEGERRQGSHAAVVGRLEDLAERRRAVLLFRQPADLLACRAWCTSRG